jgi:hypothetical protein
MGWNAMRALQAHGGKNAIMVVLIGEGHVAYGLGAERQVRLWFAGETASVLPMPVADAPNQPLVHKVQASYANFIWGLPPTTDPIYPTVGLSTPEQKSGEHFKLIQVAKESPAAVAGLAAGDELVSIDGVAIQDKETSNRLLAEKRWGDALVYKVLREGQERTFTVMLRRTPPPASAAGAPAQAETPAAAIGQPGAASPAVPAPPPSTPASPAPAKEGSAK